MLPVPVFDIRRDVIHTQELPGGGFWGDEPYRVIGFGFFYFTAVAVSETFGHSRIARVRARVIVVQQ